MLRSLNELISVVTKANDKIMLLSTGTRKRQCGTIVGHPAPSKATHKNSYTGSDVDNSTRDAAALNRINFYINKGAKKAGFYFCIRKYTGVFLIT